MNIEFMTLADLRLVCRLFEFRIRYNLSQVLSNPSSGCHHRTLKNVTTASFLSPSIHFKSIRTWTSVMLLVFSNNAE